MQNLRQRSPSGFCASESCLLTFLHPRYLPPGFAVLALGEGAITGNWKENVAENSAQKGAVTCNRRPQRTQGDPAGRLPEINTLSLLCSVLFSPVGLLLTASTWKPEGKAAPQSSPGWTARQRKAEQLQGVQRSSTTTQNEAKPAGSKPTATSWTGRNLLLFQSVTHKPVGHGPHVAQDGCGNTNAAQHKIIHLLKT